MSRLLSRLPLLFLFLQWLPAFAADEVPAEKASPAVVIGFLVFFVGACVAYGVYLAWSQKRKPVKDE